jgi:hypothetical protein
VLGDFGGRSFLVEAIGEGRCLLARLAGELEGFAVLERSFYGQGFISPRRAP